MPRNKPLPPSPFPMFKTIALVGSLLVVLILALFLKPFTIVGAGDRGVVLHWGAFQGHIMQPGFNPRWPISEYIVSMSVQTQKIETDSETYSKDLQTVSIHSALTYALDPAAVGDIYKDVGLGYADKLLAPAIQSTVKQSIAKYTAEELVTHRAQAQDEIETTLRARLSQQHILVQQYSLVNEDFDDKYEAAINQKQVEQQNAEKAKYVTAQKEQEKQQAILAAQALAETSKLQADALASQNGDKVIQLKLAEAALEAAKRWSGNLPTTMVPGGALPFLNIPAIK